MTEGYHHLRILKMEQLYKWLNPGLIKINQIRNLSIVPNLIMILIKFWFDSFDTRIRCSDRVWMSQVLLN